MRRRACQLFGYANPLLRAVTYVTRRDKSAASSVRTKRNTTPSEDSSASYLSESKVAKMSIKEYEKRSEEIFEAQRQGKFIYDMSKK